MSTPVKIVIGLSATFCILLIALLFFLRNLVVKSFPVTNGTVTVNGIHDVVDVARDEYGVPHILANNEDDLMFAAGYVQAQDRLWQMDLGRRIGEGRLSEVFDTATVRTDKLFRTLGFPQLAETLYENLHPESRKILEDYAAGVNAFIDSHKGRYPIEFDMLNYEPEPWKPQHSLLLARLMAWELNFSWWEELTYAELQEKLSPEKFRELVPSWPDTIPTTIPSPSKKQAFLDRTAAEELHGFMAEAREYRDRFGVGPFSGASNAWVVSGAKSMSGKPLLANDPHLKMSAPARWYEMHLSAPGWNVSGMSIPGIPLVVIGHNDSLAWGATNAMLDDADFYLDRIDSTHPGRYFYKAGSLPIRTRDEMILIGTNDSIEVTVRSTHHGPVINEVHPSREHNGFSRKSNPYLIALRWTGFEKSDEIYGFALMNKAANRGQFEEGTKEIAVPAQALVYADAAGNIGFRMAGRVPIRGKQNPMLPVQGWTGETEWQGYVPFDRLPQLWNPPGGFIVCANQKIAGNDYPFYLSNYWEPPSRMQRIDELLNSSEKFSADDFKRFQQDVLSPYCRSITKRIFGAYPADSTIPNGDVRNALEYLHNWDYRCTTNDIATTIFNVFFVKLLHNTYEDEMGHDVFNDFVFFSAIPYRVTQQLLAADSSAWFDNVGTSTVESKNDIIRRSLLDAVTELRQHPGGEMKTWQWGSIHEALFAHPFGKRKPLDRVFNVGPFPIAGSATTVNKGDFSLKDPYTLFSGPSMRQVVDLAKPDIAWTILPLGQSGQAFHNHYKDQTPLWMNGGYHAVSIERKEILSRKWEHLRLQPAGR